MEITLTFISVLAGAASAIAVVFQVVIAYRQNRLMKTQVELQRQTTQAYNVAIWAEESDYTGKMFAIISNNSQGPIYKVEVISHLGGGFLSEEYIKIIPPGIFRTEVEFDKGSEFGLRFTDSSGLRWERGDKGRLTHLLAHEALEKSDTFELYSYKKGKDSTGYLKEIANELKTQNKILKKR
ncbi:hypothetical protein OfM1_20700 [Lactovum odontotermitis]